MSIGGGVVEKFQKPDFGRVVVSCKVLEGVVELGPIRLLKVELLADRVGNCIFYW